MQDAAHQLCAKRLQQLNSVKRFLQSQNPLMLIVGEKDNARSNLLADIVLQLRVSRHIIRLQGHQDLHPSQLAKVLSKHWAIHNTDNSQRIENQLDQILRGLAEHDQTCILVVDDAHLLSLSGMAALSHLATQQDGNPVHLHLLLSGRPILSEKMNSLQTKEIPQITIGALSREEAFRKIKSLVDKAGMTLPHTAANVILTKIYQRSGGMQETLEHMVGKLIAQRSAIDSIPEENASSPTAAKVITPERNFWKKHLVKTLALLGLIVTGVILWQMQHQPKKPLTWPKDTIQYTQKHLNATFANATPKRQHKNSATRKQKIRVLANTAISPPPVIATNKPPEYTLQLMSSTNKKALKDFIKTNHLRYVTEAVKTQYKGSARYVLTYGHFKSPDSAKKALKHLPKSLQQLHPWIRLSNHLRTIT